MEPLKVTLTFCKEISRGWEIVEAGYNLSNGKKRIVLEVDDKKFRVVRRTHSGQIFKDSHIS